MIPIVSFTQEQRNSNEKELRYFTEAMSNGAAMLELFC